MHRPNLPVEEKLWQILLLGRRGHCRSQPPRRKTQEPDWWDEAAGFVSAVPVGVSDLPLTVLDYGAQATDAMGWTENRAPAIRQGFDRFNRENFPAAFNGTTGSEWGRWFGQELATAPLPATKVLTAARRLPGGSKLTHSVRAMADDAMNGARDNLMVSSDSEESLWQQAARGAVGGAVIKPVLKSGAAKILSPQIPASARGLLDAERSLTIGQTLGGRVQRIEDSVASWPGIGAPVRAAQERGVESVYPGLTRIMNEAGHAPRPADLRPFEPSPEINRGATGLVADLIYSQGGQTALRTVVSKRSEEAGIIGDYLRGTIGGKVALKSVFGR